MKFFKKTGVIALALLSFMVVNSVQAASMVNAMLNVDDRFKAYISTSNTTAGKLIIQDSQDLQDNWTGFSAFSNYKLDEGQDYYLHIYGKNGKGIAGFIGDFWLNDTSTHEFTFNKGELVTTSDTAAWQVDDTGWDDYDGEITVMTGGWTKLMQEPDWNVLNGRTAIATDWIWDAAFNGKGTNNLGGDEAYFSLKINANTTVPEPGVTLLLASGLLAFAGTRKKKQKA